jgi:hypothetical protein
MIAVWYRTHRPFLLLLSVYFVVTLWLAFRLPAFSGPNEHLHYEYVALLLRTRTLPDPTTSLRPDERHQPFVYYLVAALAGLPFQQRPLDTDLPLNPHYVSTHRGNLNLIIQGTPASVPILYASRLASLAFGLLGLVAVYTMARLTLPDAGSLMVVSLVAFQPMYLYLSAVASNDLAATALAAGLLAYTTWIIVRYKGPFAFAGWGVIFALVLLTKSNVIFLAMLLPLAGTVLWWRSRRNWFAVQSMGLAAIGFLLPWGAWQLYNRTREVDPLGVYRSVPVDRLLQLNLQDFSLILPHLDTMWYSFWLDWSASAYGFAPEWLYIVSGLFLIFGFAGWIRVRGWTVERTALWAMHALFALSLYLFVIAVKTLMIKEVGFLVPEGRWALPMLPSLAWLVGSGWYHWFQGRRWRYALPILAWTHAVAIVVVAAFLVPALYPTAQKVATSAAIPAEAIPVGITYGDHLLLESVETEPLFTGKESTVTLYWQALHDIEQNYTVSVQLLDPDEDIWRKMAWANSYPGNGMNPTAHWYAGDRYRDRVWLSPHEPLVGPTRALLGVWVLSDLASEEVLPTQRDGQPFIPIVQEVVVRPFPRLQPAQDAQLSAPVNFGDLIDLIGLSAIPAGSESARLTLWWQAKRSIDVDYNVFIHLVDSQGQLVWQQDSRPNHGRSPTYLWLPDDVTEDSYLLPDPMPEASQLLIGFYDLNTLERLPVFYKDEFLPDRALAISVAEHPFSPK